MNAPNAIGMLCRIPRIKVFWVKPSKCQRDLKWWSLIMSQWQNVNFGAEIALRVPTARAFEKFLESLPLDAIF